MVKKHRILISQFCTSRTKVVRIGAFGVILSNDVLVCGGVSANKQPLNSCDLLKDKSAWIFDKSELENDMIFSAAAPSPFKDWFITGGYQGKYVFAQCLAKKLFFLAFSLIYISGDMI